MKRRMYIGGLGVRAVQAALILFGLTVVTACGNKAMTLFFDVPPPKPEAPVEVKNEKPRSAQASPEALGYVEDSNAERPPIEAVTTWKQALEMLPTDKKKRVNWSQAVRDGIIKPRALAPKDLGAKAFKMDFFIQAEKPKNDAWFPHSAHTEWLGCKNCHNVNLYPYRRNPVKMKQIKKGESCGACHGKVAFSLKSCKRCHTNK